VTVPVGAFTAGLAICYDLRFAELFLALAPRGANVIVLPAAFTAETGEAHWATLLRARAIETQCWVGLRHHRHPYRRGRPCPAHLRPLHDHRPAGTIVAQASNGTGWATAALSSIRSNMSAPACPSRPSSPEYVTAPHPAMTAR
jgi:nitrilase